MKTDSFVKILKSKGFRITKARRVILDIFVSYHRPFSVDEIRKLTKQKNVTMDKTTAYRAVQFFIKQSIIRGVNFKERKKRYELDLDHHHHLVCKKCKVARKISSNTLEEKIRSLEQALEKNSNFQNITHSLEFFGLCNACI